MRNSSVLPSRSAGGRRQDGSGGGRVDGPPTRSLDFEGRGRVGRAGGGGGTGRGEHGGGSSGSGHGGRGGARAARSTRSNAGPAGDNDADDSGGDDNDEVLEVAEGSSFCNNSIGLARGPSGEVIAGHHWWKKNLEGQKNKAFLRKLMHAEPEWTPQLEIMFKNVAADGSTLYIPGEEYDDKKEKEEEEEQEAEEEETSGSPMSSCSKRMASSTSTTTSSPGNKPKGDIMTMMNKMMNKWEFAKERNHAILKADQMDKAKQRYKLEDDVKLCMDLALECGAAPGSVELF